MKPPTEVELGNNKIGNLGSIILTVLPVVTAKMIDTNFVQCKINLVHLQTYYLKESLLKKEKGIILIT